LSDTRFSEKQMEEALKLVKLWQWPVGFYASRTGTEIHSRNCEYTGQCAQPLEQADTHDYEFKKRSVRKFLGHGDKVKVTIRFRGREFNRQDLGATALNRLASELEDIAKVESQLMMVGRQMVMILRAS
jgi:hypothetical protein